MVNDYFTAHQLSPADRALFVTYAREDLRNDLRAFAWGELLGIIRTPAEQRTSLENDVVSAFGARIKAFEVDAAQEAVDHKNALIKDMCRWKPDPDIAKAYNFTYDGSYWCSQNDRHALFLGMVPPVFPSKDYFRSYGQKKIYFEPLKTNYLGGVAAFRDISTGSKLILAFGSIAMIGLVSLAMVLKVSAIAKVVFPNSGFSMMSGISLAVTLALMVLIIVVAVVLMYEGQAQLDALGQLDQDQAAIRNSAVNLDAMTKDSKGMARMTAAYTMMALPDLYSQSSYPTPTPLPARSNIDPVFVLFDWALHTQTVTDKLSYRNWDNIPVDAQMYGGWFMQKITFGPSTVDSFGLKMQYLWNGKKYTLDRSADLLVVTKNDPAPSDTDCPAGPSGVSDATYLSQCKTFVAKSVMMDLPTGQREVSLAQAPAFVSQLGGAFSIGQGKQTLQVEAVGLPLPSITIDSPLPPGVTFENSSVAGAGKARFQYDGTSGTAVFADIPIRAAHDGGSTTATYKMIIATQVKIVPPTPPTVTYGVPASFTIQSTGSPRPTFSVINSGNPDLTVRPLCQMSLVNNGDGTATVTGIPQLQFTSGCAANIKADNGLSSDSAYVSYSAIFPPQPNFLDNTVDFIVGQPNSIVLKTSPAASAVPVVIQYPPLSVMPGYANRPPSWLQLVNHGNGTATLSGTPPADSPEFFNVEVQVFTEGLTYTGYKEENLLRMHVVKYPQVSSPMYGFWGTQYYTDYNGTLTLPGTVSVLGASLPPGFNLFSTGTNQFRLNGRGSNGGETGVFLRASNGNSTGTDDRWFRIIVTENPTLRIPFNINFYIGQTKTLPILTSGYPMQPLEGIPNPPGPMQLSLVGVLPPGLSLVQTDPDTGQPTYGKALLTGKPTTVGSTTLVFYAENGIQPRDVHSLTVRVTIPGDVNGDGKVSCDDVNFITARYGIRRGQEGYDYNADYNMDGVIDVRDTAQVTPYLPAGTRCQ
ncbi:dockerin type I repeat-containing protein [Bryobacter aggregatus]|uniref:dockerin type I repeat-containing protein n=1 Tax=Bryobacter aggregatus TaxID=360054 RepID=UPI0012BA64FB|nr:dockerin type I repeat-containing protein [Bryobacter aggregatus]